MTSANRLRPAWDQQLRDALRLDSVFWRQLMTTGIQRGPDTLVRYAPAVLGWTLSTALPERRQQVLSMLRKVYGRRSKWVEARDVAQVFANFAGTMSDAILLGSKRGYRAQSHPLGAEHFRTSLARGQGIVLTTAQTAGWDTGGPIVSAHYQREVMVVMDREPNREAREMHDVARRRSGIKLVHVGDEPLAALPLLRQLRQGGVVAMKIDRRRATMRSRSVRFFGQPWQIPEGPLTLAALSGAPIVLVLTRRLGFLHYAPHNHPPLYLPRRPSEEVLNAAAQRLASDLEAFIRRHPTHYFNFS